MVKALIARGVGQQLQVQDVELRPMGPSDVRVRIAGVGVCHSDLSMVNGTLSPEYPLALGHEASGIVADVGAEVTAVNPGDSVILNWAVPCRTCWFCTHGQPWLCASIEGVTTTPGGALADGTPLNMLLGVGAMAEEVVVPANAVIPVPEGVALEEAALLGCAVLTGIGAARKAAAIVPGDSVLVLGLGGIGLSAITGARIAGAGSIIAVDTSAAKEELARHAGATDFLLAEPKLPRAIRSLTGGRGVDRALECVGTAATIRQAWEATRRGGTCVIVGVGPRSQEVTFNPLELFHFSRTLTSSVFGNADAAADIPKLGQLIRAGALDLSAMVTYRIALEGIPEAFERMSRGEGGRSLAVLSAG